MAIKFKTIISDPEFYTLPVNERKKVLISVAPDFQSLPINEQDKVLQDLEQQYGSKQTSRQTSELPSLDLMPAHAPEMAASHAPTPTPKTDFLRQWVSPIARGTLEGGGALGGTLLGAPSGPAGAAAGGILGYGAGAQASDLVDEALGLRAQKTISEALAGGIKDLAVGSAYTAGGEIVGRGVMAGLKGGKVVFDKIGSGLEKSAAKRIAAYTSEGPIYAKNAEEAMQIEDIINANRQPGDPKFQFNIGQRSGDPNQIKLEINAALAKGKGAELKDAKAMENAAALARYRKEHFGGEEGIEDVLGAVSAKGEALERGLTEAEKQAQRVAGGIETKPAQQTGYELMDEIGSAMTPVKNTMGELKSQVPDYPIKLTSLETEMHLLSRDPDLSEPQKTALKQFETYIKDAAPNWQTTTRNAMGGIDRTLDDYARTAYNAKQDSIGQLFTRLKNRGLKNDIEAVSDLARTGKLVEYKGQAVDADQLAAQLEDDLLAVADMRQSTVPDIDAIRQGIKDAGKPVPMQVVRESDTDFLKRLSRQYEITTGKEIPTKGGSSPEAIKKLEDRIAENKQILSEVSPGQDVGAAISAYKRYAREEYFGRFKKGVMEDVTAKGNEYTGGRIQIEDIPKRFKDPSGADDLVRAIGQPKAKEIMRGNIAYDVIDKVVDKTTGEVRGKALDAWLASNGEILEKYGLQDEFKGLQNVQALVDQYKGAAKEFEKSVAGKMIGFKVSGKGYQVNPDNAISVVMEGKRTAAQMQELVDMVKDNPAAVNGLKNAYGNWITDNARTTWKGAADEQTVSAAQFIRTMQKAREGAQVLYRNEPEKVQALETMQRAYEIMARSSRSPGGVGSDTAEKVLGVVSNQAANAIASGSMTFRAARGFYNFLSKIGTTKRDELVARAVFDPDYAYNLVNGVRGKIDPNKVDAVMNEKVILLDEYRKSRARTAAMVYGDKTQSQNE